MFEDIDAKSDDWWLAVIELFLELLCFQFQ